MERGHGEESIHVVSIRRRWQALPKKPLTSEGKHQVSTLAAFTTLTQSYCRECRFQTRSSRCGEKHVCCFQIWVIRRSLQPTIEMNFIYLFLLGIQRLVGLDPAYSKPDTCVHSPVLGRKSIRGLCTIVWRTACTVGCALLASQHLHEQLLEHAMSTSPSRHARSTDHRQSVAATNSQHSSSLACHWRLRRNVLLSHWQCSHVTGWLQRRLPMPSKKNSWDFFAIVVSRQL